MIIKIIAGIAVLAVAGFAFWKLESNDAMQESANQNATDTAGMMVETTTTTSTTTVTTTAKYKDGTYTKTGTYNSPAGSEQVEVTLTLKGDIVTDAVFVGKATNPGSKMAQSAFAAGFKTLVVGKNIDDIKLTVVNGSSLTPKGFMDALVKIQAEAKA